MVDKNRKIRQDMLDVLYTAKSRGNGGLRRDELEEKLTNEDNDVKYLDFNLRWLVQKEYASCEWLYGGDFFATIADKGIDHMEAGNNFELIEQPKAQQQPQTGSVTVNGPNYGIINTGPGSTISYSQQITNAFNQAYSMRKRL